MAVEMDAWQDSDTLAIDGCRRGSVIGVNSRNLSEDELNSKLRDKVFLIQLFLPVKNQTTHL